MVRRKPRVPTRFSGGADNRKSNAKREITVTCNGGFTQMNMTKKMYRQIKLLQMSTKLLIPKLPFSRLVREIMIDLIPNALDFRFQYSALLAMQESCELYMTSFFEDSYVCTLHAKRKTLQISDMQLCRRLRGRQDIIN